MTLSSRVSTVPVVVVATATVSRPAGFTGAAAAVTAGLGGALAIAVAALAL